MLSDGFQVYFSCKRENTQWLSTLVLNHASVSNLNTLIAHNYKFFNNSFDNLVFLDLCLKFKKGFNYRSLDCKTKNRYFSELKCLIKDFNFTRCTKIYVFSEAIKFALLFKGNDVNYFESLVEFCYDKEPDCEDYLVSKSLEFPYEEEMLKEIYDSKKDKKERRREGKVDLFKRLSRQDILVIINELSIEDFDIENMDFCPIIFQHPLEGCEPQDLTEEERKELNSAKKFIKERKDKLTFALRDLYKSRFIYTDVNHLNRPIIMKHSMEEYFNMAEEEKKKLIEGFKFFHGVKGFDIVGGEKELDEFKGSFHFLKNRLTLMGGVSEELVGKEVWSSHMAMLKELKQVNQKLKKVEEKILNSKVEQADLIKRRAELELMKYDQMLKIKALYPKGAFIEDIYLDRDTSSWKNAEICRFITASIKYRETMEDFFTPSEKHPGRNKLSEGIGINNIKIDEDVKKWDNYEKYKKEADERLRSIGIFVPKGPKATEDEAYQLSLNMYLDSKRVYTTELERLKACAGYEIAEILSTYFVERNDKKEKNLYYRLEEAKKQYNFMIKDRKKWTEDDHVYFLKNLECIFENDEDFEKYLTSDFKQDLSARIETISKEMAAVIKIANNCPKCFEEKQELIRLNSEKEKNSVKTASEVLGGNVIKLMNSFIEMESGVTRKGGLKLKELGESSKGVKSKKKSLSVQDEVATAWEKNKLENSNKLIRLINSYKRIYNSLGDTVILDPLKYGISPYYCTCSSGGEGLHMHYRNATLRNLNVYQVKEAETLKLKEEVEKAEKRIKSLNSKKEEYTKFTKNMEELERQNAEYMKKREEERALLIEDIKRKIAHITINKSLENSNRFMREVQSNWNNVITKCTYNIQEKNRLMLEDSKMINESFYKKLSLEKVKFFKESITKVARETNEIKAKKRMERGIKRHEELVRLGLEKPKSVAVKNKFELLFEDDDEDTESGFDGDESDEEEVLESYADYERKWVEIANKRREEHKIKQVELIEVSNKYELMYHDEKALKYANESADTFLATSKNVRLLSDLSLRVKKNNKIREIRDNIVSRDGVCGKSTLANIHVRCGSHYIKEYSVTNIKPVLVLMFLCLVNKVPVDCKFIKTNYGMKRCQVNYIYNSIKCSMRILGRSADCKKEQNSSI